MMKHYALTSALPAIAAALALSSTSALAQQVQPVPTDPAPAAQPAPATDSAPTATQDSSAATAEPDSSAADSAPAATTKTVKRVTRHTVAKAAGPVTRTAVRTASAKSVTTAARSPASAPAPVAPTPAATPVQQSQRPKPIVDLNAKPPAATPAVAAKPAKKKDPTLPIAGGALAFLAIGGAAAAMTRRRHDEEEEWNGEETVAEQPADETPIEEPVVHEEQPAIIAPVAFDWDGGRSQDDVVERPEGETFVDRAYRGPTPDNPSLSLKKRLKRAAFLDQRERDVAAGKAVPVDATAGLPDRMVKQRQA